MSYDNIALYIFKDSNSKIYNWETLQLATFRRSILSNFKFHTNYFKGLVTDKKYNNLFQGFIFIKNGGGFIWLVLYLFKYNDFYILLIFPLLILIRIIIEKYWYKRIILTLIFSFLISFVGILVEINTNYWLLFNLFLIIQTIILDIYNLYLTKPLYLNEQTFNEYYSLILNIYDKETKTNHKLH